MISIVPIQHIQTAIRSDLQRDRHEPCIVAVQQVGLGLRQVSRTIALQSVHVECASVNVADNNSLAVLRRIRIGVEIRNAAVRRFLMPMVRDGTKRNRERRESPGLPLVMPRLHEMKEMIVRPMTRLDNRAAFRVPREAVRIARAFGYDLEFARAWMYPPKRAIEFIFLAVVRADLTLVEHAVQSIEPSIRSPCQRVG